MLNKNWSVKDVGSLQTQIADLKVQIKADIPLDEAIRMQLEVLLFATSLTETINHARFYEAKMSAERNREFTKAFLSTIGSDRKRDAEAKASPDVRVAESKAYEAEVYRKLLEDIKADFLLIHYSLRAILRDKTEEKRWG